MKRLLILTAVAVAALTSAACVTVIDANSDYGWSGENAQPFDDARDSCRASAGRDEGTTGYVRCMADKGWTRSRD